MDEGGNRVEGVEEEMRLQLHLEGLQARLGQSGFKHARMALAFPGTRVKQEGMSHADNGPINGKLGHGAMEDDITDRRLRWGTARRRKPGHSGGSVSGRR